MNNQYGEEYFAWQKKIGEIAVMCDFWKFKRFIGRDDVVLDFGCGGGYFLAGYDCRDKYGIEINPRAREIAVQNGIKTVESVTDLPETVQFDLIISNHALEHVQNPWEAIAALRTKLKDTGRVVFYVPLKSWWTERKYDESDVNKHLYAWTPLLLGNLFATAGYKVQTARIVTHAWLPLSRVFGRLPGFIFHPACVIWSVIIGQRQTMIVASKG